ncbi:M48 family peptidase [Arthrobacter sp. AQ5-05]|uniref:M48 family metallopeptidase n=1 Tax=Arthrobacter sp. AQ5-05 TaxID=2184581 RepID=UPI000DCDFE92|nr:SprT family zinc-dependent metalloprotease [Arthrobacter sp. AQ5-05]RAX50312.1 M48 family peptidase [Arthrobacter sp. AQ5-05]
MSHVVEYGSKSIGFVLERRERTTLEITVSPDGTVGVIAPVDSTDAEINSRVLKRARWILKQQSFFAQFLPRTPPRVWAPGETHLYLGRQYRLRIGEAEGPARVRLIRGFILVDGIDFSDRTSIEALVTTWYREHAAAQFKNRIEVCRAKFQGPEFFAPASVQIRRMNSRWGSMSPAGMLSLNPELVKAPVECIDYVITHELCHLRVPHHGPEFIELLCTVMPDWESRKLRMERMLS